MPTRYPTDLPAVPRDRWNAAKTAETEIVIPDEGWGEATTRYAIDAPTGPDAERRVLAWIHHCYEDDLERAVAEATQETEPGRWAVTLKQYGEY